MLAALADLAVRRPWSLLAGSLAVLGGAVAVAIGAPDELGVGSMRLLDGPREPGAADAELVVVLSGDEPVDSRIFRVSRDVVVAQIEADPAVASVRELDRGETSVALVAAFGGASDGERQEAAVRLAKEIDPGSLRARVGGEVQRLLSTRREAAGDLWRAELVVLPFVLLVAVAAAGLRQAAAPILCAAIAIGGSLAVLRLIGLAADVSLLGFAPAAAVGLVPSIAATLIGALAAGAMVTAGPYPVRELGLALAVGLAGDLLLLRAPLAPLTSRWIRSARV